MFRSVKFIRRALIAGVLAMALPALAHAGQPLIYPTTCYTTPYYTTPYYPTVYTPVYRPLTLFPNQYTVVRPIVVQPVVRPLLVQPYVQPALQYGSGYRVIVR